MYEITQIRRLSLWIFFIPLIAINTCLIISQNADILSNNVEEQVAVLEAEIVEEDKDGNDSNISVV